MRLKQAGHPQAHHFSPLDLEKAGARADYMGLASRDRNSSSADSTACCPPNAAILGTLTPLGLYDVDLWLQK